MKKPNMPVQRQRPTQTANPAQQQVTMQQWQGPLPPPGALAQFDQIVPGSAERIIAMVEREQTHRQQHEAQEQRASIGNFNRGQLMAFALSMVSIAGSIFTAYIHAHPTVSIALVSLPIMAAIRSFMKRK